MIQRLLALSVLLTFACGKLRSPVAPLASDFVTILRAKYAQDSAALRAASDQKTGWPSSADCDGTLWAGEAAAGGATWVDLALAEPAPGQIVRSPSNPCTPSSRDMVLGYALGRWETGDGAALKRLADYGEAHAWKMSSDLSLSLIDPVSQGILGRALKALTGDTRPYASFPMVCVPLTKDFEQHLEVLETVLAGEVASSVPAVCVDVLRGFAAASPDDALFAAAYANYTGDFTHAMELLTDSYTCPSYVRGAPAYCLVHKVFAERLILKRYSNP